MSSHRGYLRKSAMIAWESPLGEILVALVSPFLSERFEHPLSKKEFDRLHASQRFLSDYMRFEETVLHCLYSFQEFEEFILKSALHHYLFPMSEYDFFQDTRVRANIKVTAFLNAVTSFRDQFPKFKSSPELSTLRAQFLSCWNEQRKNSVSFAFFERLRNYAQHQTQPVSSFTTGGGWDEKRGILESKASIYVDVNEVCSNRDIDKNERSRFIQALGEKADLSLVFRETMGRLGAVVEIIRDETKSTFANSEMEMERALAVAAGYKENFIVCDAVIFKVKRQKSSFLFLEISWSAQDASGRHI